MFLQKKDKLTCINNELPNCLRYGIDNKKEKIQREWKQYSKLQELNDKLTTSIGAPRALGEVRDIKLELLRNSKEL